ncbi:MAG: phosphoribosyl-AMP cyclohydrolase [Cyanobium sp.]
MNRCLAATCGTMLLPLLVAAPGAAMADSLPMRLNTNITEQQVLNAQQGWCNGLLAISKAYATGGFKAAETTANQILDQAYGYQYGAVAFKPTLTQNPQTFRPTKAGALAYFIGGNPSYPNDKGFAIKPWQSCAIRNQVIQLHGELAVTMGNVDLTDSSGKVTTVDKTWAFMREPDGEIRIVLHHSSLPFTVK